MKLIEERSGRKYSLVVVLILGVGFILKDYPISMDLFLRRDWYKYNVAQRIHLNYVEGINFGQISLLSAALYRPK